MTILRWAAMALALSMATGAAAQNASSVQAPAGYAPMSAPCIKQVDATCAPISTTSPMPVDAPKATSTAASGSVAVAGTYQSVLAANAARKGCLIQNTSAAPLKLFLGAPGSATDAASLQLAAGASFSCAAPGGMVITDQISLTAATASATFVIVSQ